MSTEAQMSTVDKISEKFQPVISAISTSKVINSIIGGMLATLPAIIIGAFCSIILNIKIGGFEAFVQSTGIAAVCTIVVAFTINFVAILYTFAISATYAKQFDEDGLFPALLSVIIFFVLTPMPESGGIGTDWLGSMGIFSGIIISLVSTRLYVLIKQKGMVIAMPSTVPPVVTNSFVSLIPSILVIILFMIIAGIFSSTSWGSVHQLIYGSLQTPLMKLGATFPSFFLLSLLAAIFWWFGIQGTMVTMGAVLSLLLALDGENLTAYSAGLTPPNIAGWAFYYTYCITSGLLGLNILMLFARSKRYRTLGKITLVPSICGITEPMIFGTPVVYDVWLFVPFVLAQIVPISLAWFATAVGIIPTTAGVFTAGGMPVIITGFIQGSWKIAVFQVLMILLQMIIWLPFFRKTDKQALLQETGELQTAEA